MGWGVSWSWGVGSGVASGLGGGGWVNGERSGGFPGNR